MEYTSWRQFSEFLSGMCFLHRVIKKSDQKWNYLEKIMVPVLLQKLPRCPLVSEVQQSPVAAAGNSSLWRVTFLWSSGGSSGILFHGHPECRACTVIWCVPEWIKGEPGPCFAAVTSCWGYSTHQTNKHCISAAGTGEKRVTFLHKFWVSCLEISGEVWERVKVGRFLEAVKAGFRNRKSRGLGASCSCKAWK